MSGTRIVHCKREKYDVYIGRPSKWGNPYKIDKHTTREQAIEKYEAYVMQNEKLLPLIAGLKGKILGCWCSPEKCHGDILARMADET